MFYEYCVCGFPTILCLNCETATKRNAIVQSMRYPSREMGLPELGIARFRSMVAIKLHFKSKCAQKPNIFKIWRQQPKKKNSGDILRLATPWCETNHGIFRLAEYRFIYDKIDNNRIPSNASFGA